MPQRIWTGAEYSVRDGESEGALIGDVIPFAARQAVPTSELRGSSPCFTMTSWSVRHLTPYTTLDLDAEAGTQATTIVRRTSPMTVKRTLVHTVAAPMASLPPYQEAMPRGPLMPCAVGSVNILPRETTAGLASREPTGPIDASAAVAAAAVAAAAPTADVQIHSPRPPLNEPLQERPSISQLMSQQRTTGQAAQVVRQTTPLSYRVKDNADGDEGGKETTMPKPGLRRPSPSPIVMSRSLDRERHGGISEGHPECDCNDERYEGSESARTLPPIPDPTGYSRTCLHEESRPPVEPAARSQSPPRSQGTPQLLTGLRGLECERPGAAEAVNSVLSSMRTTRLHSPALSPGRACRVTTRTQSRSPTPQSTPIALYRHTGKSTPVTIWHGLDKERVAPGGSVEVPAFKVTPSKVTWPHHGLLSPRAPVLGLDPPPVVAPPPPMVVTRSPARSLEPRNRSELITGGASATTRGGSVELQQPQQQQQQQQSPPVPPMPANEQVSTEGRCRSSSRDLIRHTVEQQQQQGHQQQHQQQLVRAPVCRLSPDRAQLSVTLRHTLTPSRSRRANRRAAATASTATPFSSRSTLPANFRASATWAGHAASASALQTPRAFCGTPLAPIASGAISPRVSPRDKSTPSNASSPALPYPPCTSPPRQQQLGTGAPPPPVHSSSSGRVRHV